MIRYILSLCNYLTINLLWASWLALAGNVLKYTHKFMLQVLLCSYMVGWELLHCSSLTQKVLSMSEKPHMIMQWAHRGGALLAFGEMFQNFQVDMLGAKTPVSPWTQYKMHGMVWSNLEWRWWYLINEQYIGISLLNKIAVCPVITHTF